MKHLSFAYDTYHALHKKAPADLETFSAFIAATTFPPETRKWEEECLARVKAGDYVILWNQKLSDDNKKTLIVAHEKSAPDTGGFVVLASGDLKYMTAQELKAATRK